MWNTEGMDKIRAAVSPVVPVSVTVDIRTEFSGAGVGDFSAEACAAAFRMTGGAMTVNCKSTADWNLASQKVLMANIKEACHFSDIMSIVPEEMKDKLQRERYEEAHCHFQSIQIILVAS
jgi:hypothetical protein